MFQFFHPGGFAFKQYWYVLSRARQALRQPDGARRWEQLVSTLLYRMIAALMLQGAGLILVGRLFGPLLPYLGVAYLIVAGTTLMVKRKFGSSLAYRSGFLVACAGLLPYAAIGGGIYSHAVISLAMLTVSSAFFFRLRTTVWIIAIQAALMGGMAALQANGMWFETALGRTPGVTWLLVTLLTINYAIPLVTTIEAYREVLAQLEIRIDALHAAESEARRLLDAQRRFFWDISHELRSPITRLNLSVGKLRREADSQGGVALARMENEVERLNTLVQQLLLLAQLKHGVQFPMDQQFDLAAEAGSVCADAEFEANVNGKDLVWECEESLRACPMVGCAELLRRALDNVVRNAIRFAPEGSEVGVRLRPAGPGVVGLSVEDRGPGVPEAQIAMLFDPFFRVLPDSQSSDRHPGSGLGLAIASEAIKKHGGRIEAANREGGGLRVTMEIPGWSAAVAQVATPASIRRETHVADAG